MFHGENCHGLFQTWEIGRYAGNVCEKWKTDEFQEEQMDFLSSNSFLMMEKSMMFLWTKQAAILDNIANAETPGYKAKIVTFEETLKARAGGGPAFLCAEKRGGSGAERFRRCGGGTDGVHPYG